MKIQESGLKKRHIFFALENVFMPPGSAMPSKKMLSLLEFLHGLSEKGMIHLYLVSGLHGDKARKKLEQLGLSKYFSDAKFFFVTHEYIHAKAEVDRDRHLESLKNDPDFLDHYLKQAVILEMVGSGKISKEESVLVGNDLMFDAFYTSRFSGIDFVLVKDSLSLRGEPVKDEISGLNYISMEKGDFKKILYWEFAKNDIAALEKRIFDEIGKALIGDKIKDAVASRGKRLPN